MKPTAGQSASRSLTVTMGHITAYAEITGDYNPLHFDEEFVGKTRFKRLIAQGGITTGLLHAIVAMELPGPGTVFLSQNWSFKAPVYVGDTITGTVEVISVHPLKPVSQLRVEVRRQDDELVLEGEAWCYTLAPVEDANME